MQAVACIAVRGQHLDSERRAGAVFKRTSAAARSCDFRLQGTIACGSACVQSDVARQHAHCAAQLCIGEERSRSLASVFKCATVPKFKAWLCLIALNLRAACKLACGPHLGALQSKARAPGWRYVGSCGVLDPVAQERWAMAKLGRVPTRNCAQ